MSESNLSTEEIRKAGLRALRRELGPSGMARFFHEFGIGKGDYSVMRHELIGKWGIDDWMRQIRRERRSKRRKNGSAT